MSYNGTVRCRWCNELGHNQRSCPHKLKYAKRLADEGNDYLLKTMTKKQVRTCGWCGEEGHNQRSCKQRKYVYTQVPKAKQLLKDIIKKTHAQRVGKGCLVRDTFDDTRGVVTGLRKHVKLQYILPEEHLWHKLKNDIPLQADYHEINLVKPAFIETLATNVLVTEFKNGTRKETGNITPSDFYAVNNIGFVTGNFHYEVEVPSKCEDTPITITIDVPDSTTNATMDFVIEWLEFFKDKVVHDSQ